MATLPDDPERSLQQQARAGVMQLPAWMFDGLDDRERLVAVLAFEARLAGLTRIDEVVPSAGGRSVIAIQGQHGDAEHRSIHIDRGPVPRAAGVPEVAEPAAGPTPRPRRLHL